MSKTIKIGDRVAILDENVKGVVLSITGNKVIIADTDGFKRACKTNELIVYDSQLAFNTFINKKLPSINPNKSKKVAVNVNIIDL